MIVSKYLWATRLSLRLPFLPSHIKLEISARAKGIKTSWDRNQFSASAARKCADGVFNATKWEGLYLKLGFKFTWSVEMSAHAETHHVISPLISTCSENLPLHITNIIPFTLKTRVLITSYARLSNGILWNIPRVMYFLSIHIRLLAIFHRVLQESVVCETILYHAIKNTLN